MATSNKVKPATKPAIPPFTARKAAQPAAAPPVADKPADTIESLRKEAEALAVRVKAVSPKKLVTTSVATYTQAVKEGKPALKPPIVATKGQVRILQRMVAIDSELAEITASLVTERAKIKADLDAAVDAAQASAIVAESVGLQYAVEPASARVSLSAASVKHIVRAIPR